MRITAILFLLFLSSCSLMKPMVTQVKPWERDVLARENMQVNSDELFQLMDEQIYYSKEASHGGLGVGGGGCGCN